MTHRGFVAVAIRPTNIDPRMTRRRSCFTVQGKDKNSLAQWCRAFNKRYEVSQMIAKKCEMTYLCSVSATRPSFLT